MIAKKERRDRTVTRAAVLFGHDFFISFTLGPSPRGTQSYASDLARRLRERDYTVFFSEDEAPPGAELNGTLKRALQRARVLVVVLNDARVDRLQMDSGGGQIFRAHHRKRP